MSLPTYLPLHLVIPAALVSILSWYLYFHDGAKDGQYYVYIVTAVSIVSSFLHATIVKEIKDQNMLVIWGYCWDIYANLLFLLIPILFFNTSFNYKQWLGLALIGIGTLILSVNS